MQRERHRDKREFESNQRRFIDCCRQNPEISTSARASADLISSSSTLTPRKDKTAALRKEAAEPTEPAPGQCARGVRYPLSRAGRLRPWGAVLLDPLKPAASTDDPRDRTTH